MTAWTQDADEILAQARQVRFTTVLVNVFCAVFFAIGWLAGHGWLVLALAGVSVRYGFRQAVPAKPPQAAAPPERGSKL
jgi:hypothetical protein